MKKIYICLFILSVMLLTASCNHRQEIVDKYESEIEAASDARDSDVLTHNPDEPDYVGPYPNDRGWIIEAIREDGDRGYYEDKTLEELQALFTPGGAFQSPIITPTGMILEGANDTYFYNKMTGNVSVCCPDPLCEGDCFWKRVPFCLYVGETHMYFNGENPQATTPEEELVYFRCDLNRNHVEVLYYGQDTTDTIFYAEGDKVYLTRLSYRANDSATYAWGVFDCKTKKFTKLSGNKNMEGVYGVAGGRLWYTDTQSGKLYSSNLDMTDEKEHFSEYKSATICEMGENFLLMQIAPYPEEPWYFPTHVYNMKTGELTDISSWSGTLYKYEINGDYLYYQKKLSEEEIAASPHKEYYEFETEIEHTKYFTDTVYITTVETVTCPNMAAGRLYRMNLDTMEEELILEMSFGGVPALFGDYVVDGNVCYIHCSSYLSYLNYYTAGADSADEATHSSGGLALVDFSNGTVRFLDLSSLSPHG